MRSYFTISGIRFWYLLILACALMLLAGAGRAQPTESVLWSEDWEGDWFLTWFVEAGTWEVGAPCPGIGPGSAYSGQNCAATVLCGNYAEGVNSRLIRFISFVVPPANQNPRLRFWHWFNFNSGDYGVVQLRVNNGAWQTISPTYSGLSSGVWSYPSLDLSTFADSTVQIAFYFHSQDNCPGSCTDVAPGWYIDNVEVVTGPIVFNNPEGFELGLGDWFVDRGTWEVGIPGSGPGGAHTDQNCAATVLNGNYSEGVDTRLISPAFIVPSVSQNPRLRFWHWFNFNSGDYGVVQLKVNNGDWQTISPTYAGSSSGVWSYPFLDLSAYVDSTIQIAFFFHSQDNCPGSCTDVAPGWYIDDVEVVTGPIVFNNPEGFELGLGDWFVDRGTWEVGIPGSGPGGAHTDQNCAATVLNGNYAEWVDTRLISPAFVVPNVSQNPRLRFWHWYNFNSGDYGQVQISVNNGAWQTISPTYTNTGSNVWTYPSIDLAAYADSILQIAFYFHSQDNCPGSCVDVATGWYIDDIEVITGPILFNNPEYFESGLGDWYVERGTWEVGVPTAGPDTCYSPPNCGGTVLGGNYHEWVDSRLITPPFLMPSADKNPGLQFWHWFNFNSGDFGEVQIRVGDGSWQPISAHFVGNSSGVWSPYFTPLNAYADSVVQIALYFHSQDNCPGSCVDVSTGWYVDNVRIIGLSEVIASVVSPTYLPQNCSVTAKLKVDMTRAALPNNLLGSFDGTLSWNPALLQYTGNSGLLSGFSGSVNSTAGQVTFSGANSNGAGGIVNILDVYFDVIGPIGSLDTLDLEFSSMTAASTSTNLLEILTLKDKPVALIEEGLLGDVTGDDLVNSTDALVMLSYDVGTAIPQVFLDHITYGFGDVNFSGATNSTDALIVLSYDVGIPVPFPVGQLFCPPTPTLAPLFSSAKLSAGTGGEIVASSLPVKGEAVTGNIIDVPLLIDMSQSSEKLGSFTAALEWDPAVLQLLNYTGGSAGGFETPVVNDRAVKNGKLIVANANPFGAAGVVNVLNLQFKAIGEPGAAASVSAKFSALAAAETFTDLLPSLEVSEEVITLMAEEAQPRTYAIENYPNPFNPSTEIRYQLPEAGLVEIVVYNVLGQKVQTLVNEHQQPGNYLVRWEGKNEQGQSVPSGMYFLRMIAGKFVAERKLLLLK